MSDSLSIVQSVDLLRINSRIWCGEASIKRADFAPEVQASLPPSTISKLGRWNIFPRQLILTLKAHYYEGYERARRNAVSIFGGKAYAVDPAVTPRLVVQLQECKDKFDAAKSALLADYDRLFSEWLAASVPPEWQAAVAGKLPGRADVESRIRFGWEVFSISASPNDGSSSEGGTFAGAVAAMAGGAFEQMAAQAATLWNRQTGGLASVKGWTRIPDYLQALIDKAESTALFAPEIRVLADALRQAASSACRKGAKPEDTALLKGLLIAAKDADSCRILCQSGDAALASAAQSAAAPWLPQPEPEPAVQSVPDCSMPLAPAAPTPAELAEAEAVCASLSSAPDPEPEPEPAPQGQAMPDLSVVNPELAAMLGLLS